MFTKKSGQGFHEIMPGVELKVLCMDANTLMAEYRMKKGNNLPLHDHPHEQTGFLVSGEIRLIIGDDVFDARPGDAWSIPGGVVHGAEVLEDSTAIEVFSPVREDFARLFDSGIKKP